ncbi:MAG: hypothetical protein HWN79_18855 [Candidatus Lokiarchaeota archaeon]|nr:hypothetical protein [Candidatus Lokiarchaeota archaeon]
MGPVRGRTASPGSRSVSLVYAAARPRISPVRLVLVLPSSGFQCVRYLFLIYLFYYPTLFHEF